MTPNLSADTIAAAPAPVADAHAAWLDSLAAVQSAKDLHATVEIDHATYTAALIAAGNDDGPMPAIVPTEVWEAKLAAAVAAIGVANRAARLAEKAYQTTVSDHAPAVAELVRARLTVLYNAVRQAFDAIRPGLTAAQNEYRTLRLLTTGEAIASRDDARAIWTHESMFQGMPSVDESLAALASLMDAIAAAGNLAVEATPETRLAALEFASLYMRSGRELEELNRQKDSLRREIRNSKPAPAAAVADASKPKRAAE